MYGSFSEKAQEAWDFARCQRPDGSYYGSPGRCKKGTEVGANEGKEKETARKSKRTDMVAQRNEVARLKKEREEAAASGDPKKAKAARRAHIDAKNKLKELIGEHEKLRAESGDLRRFGKEMNRYKATDKELKDALDSGKLSARTAEKVRVELAQRKASANYQRDNSKDVKRGNTLIGTSPRNMTIDNINEFKARLKDARSPAEKALLEGSIREAEALLRKEDKPKRTRATSVEKEEAKLATLEKRLAAAEEKVSRARGGVTTARARSGTRLMTSAGRRAGSAADRAITKEQELSKQVREQRAKVNEMKGIKPKVEAPAPRTAKDDRRDKLRKTINSINERAKRLKASKGSDSPEFKRFVGKYGDKLTKLMDEQRKLLIET